MDFLNDFENEYVGMVGEVETIIYKLSLITKYIDLTEQYNQKSVALDEPFKTLKCTSLPLGENKGYIILHELIGQLLEAVHIYLWDCNTPLIKLHHQYLLTNCDTR